MGLQPTRNLSLMNIERLCMRWVCLKYTKPELAPMSLTSSQNDTPIPNWHPCLSPPHKMIHRSQTDTPPHKMTHRPHTDTHVYHLFTKWYLILPRINKENYFLSTGNSLFKISKLPVRALMPFTFILVIFFISHNIDLLTFLIVEL